MSTKSPLQTIRCANLELVLAEQRVGGPAELARMLGRPKMKGHLSNVRAGRRGIGDKLAAAIEECTGKPKGWMDHHHAVAGERAAGYAVAQAVTHPLASDDLPYIPWEELMHDDPVPDLFRTTLGDDAMAPDMPRGTEIVWTTRRRVAPGRLLLLRDAHGHPHARMCHQGAMPGQWSAKASNPVFMSFEHSTPGLVVVAVYKGRLEPDDA